MKTKSNLLKKVELASKVVLKEDNFEESNSQQIQNGAPISDTTPIDFDNKTADKTIKETDKALAQHKQFMKDHRETLGSEMGSEWSLDSHTQQPEKYLQSGGDVATKESALTNGVCKTSSFPSPADVHQILNEIDNDIKRIKIEDPCYNHLTGELVDDGQIINLKSKKQGIIQGYLCAINQEIEFLEICLKGYDRASSKISWSESVSNLLKVNLRELTKIKEEMEKK